MRWTIVFRKQKKTCVGRALQALEQALDRHNLNHIRYSHPPETAVENLILIGEADEPVMGVWVPERPRQPESYWIGRKDGLRIVCGSDSLGLSYALYELAELIACEGQAALLSWPQQQARPNQAIRGADKFISHHGDDRWWMSEAYWHDYLEMLVRYRFNRLTLVMGFDTAYLSPPYPFLVQLADFTRITVSPSDEKKRPARLKALRNLGRLCHDYGLHFTLAVWQQIPWQDEQNCLIHGLGRDQIRDYCAAGLTALLEQCPEIDTLHFRVNHESGVGGQDSEENYWLRQIDALAESNQVLGRDVALELRAKGMTDRMLHHARRAGLRVMVSTKYCCEHAGLPHHLTRMRSEERKNLANLNLARRYSYSDLLRKPRHFPLLYRLWNNGSTNLLTWGDPDYVRRFMDSLRLGPAAGYEVMPPLSYKGGHEFIMQDGWPVFADKSLQSPGYEDERYWLFYCLFGRLGYDAGAAETAWSRPMQLRQGELATGLLQLIEAGSRILPLVTGSHFPLHPQLQYWPELSSGGALFAENNHNPVFSRQKMTYQRALACDEGLIYGIDEYVDACSREVTDFRYTPVQIMTWLQQRADQVDRARVRLEQKRADTGADNWEIRGILLDAALLARLGHYHVAKMRAAWHFSWYINQKKPDDLRLAEHFLKTARRHWSEMSELGRAYHHDLLFGVGAQCVRRGSWSDYLPEIDRDLASLAALAQASGLVLQPDLDLSAVIPDLLPVSACQPADWLVDLPDSHPAGKDLVICLQTGHDPRIKAPIQLHWRRTNQLAGSFQRIEMEKKGHDWRACIPAVKISPEWDLLVFFTTAGPQGQSIHFPGLFHPREKQPYRIISII